MYKSSNFTSGEKSSKIGDENLQKLVEKSTNRSADRSFHGRLLSWVRFTWTWHASSSSYAVAYAYAFCATWLSMSVLQEKGILL